MLRAAMVMAGMLALPLCAGAEELHEGKFWRNCADDNECVVIEGTCDKTSVNRAFKAQAEAYYKQEQARSNCAPRPFWKSNNVMARCYLGGCQTITRQGADQVLEKKR